MGKKIFTICAILSVFLGTRSLKAFELEGLVGTLTQEDELEDNRSPIYGLRFGGGARRLFTGETTIGYSPTEFFKVYLLVGNFDINIPVDNIVPYFTIGTGTLIFVPEEGATVLDPDDPAAEAINVALNTKAKFSINYGGGVRYFLNDMLALRGDFRDHIIFDLGFDVAAAAEGDEEGVVDIGTSHAIELALGLSIVFF
ncbi:MAG: hypothetical protein ACE5OP_07680 [Candidatus Glassbacteria bacterium]